MAEGDGALPEYLTTREVADLLRVKERKVYDLAAAEEIPHRRVTGKLLFPRNEIIGWIEGAEGAAPERPPVLTGSHDPLLDWAVRESGCGLATLFNGSGAGLELFAQGRAALTGLHLPEANGWNTGSVGELGLRDCVLIGWARRRQGLILSAEAARSVQGLADLKGRKVALRQPGAGARALFEQLLAQAGLSIDALVPAEGLARTETDAAAAVAAGEAEAALGLEAAARRHGLDFLPLTEERFDLLAGRRAYFTPPVQALLRFCAGPGFAAKAAAMGGYDLKGFGEVQWLSA